MHFIGVSRRLRDIRENGCASHSKTITNQEKFFAKSMNSQKSFQNGFK